MELPLRDMDDLQPLFAVALLYVVGLVILRLFLWPAIQDLRKRNLLGRLLHVLANLMVRLFILGGIALAGFWALFVLGLDDNLFQFLGEVPDMEIGEINLVIPGVLLLLLILLWFFAIKPALAFFRSTRK
jgi:hypothetical protein